jgi:two-component system chemotaxis response regulator CheB
MPDIDVIVIGASAGGLEALSALLEEIPADLPSPIVVVIHTRSNASSYLPQILAKRTRLPVEFARHGAAIRDGHVYVAPPDFHVLVHDGRLMLSRGPKENGFRPAVDPLFRSASRAKGAGVIGVVLSGGLDDGTYGLKTIKDNGGLTIVQDPREAIVTGMPQSAIRTVEPHHVLEARNIGQLIAGTRTTASGGTGMARRSSREIDPQDPSQTTEVLDMQQEYGPPTGLTCPDCGGALWEIKDGRMTRYRCHVGHQYSSEGLDAEQHEVVEGALWSAVRVLEEHAELRRRMAARAERAGLADVSRGFETSAHDSQRQAAAIRDLLFARRTPEPDRDGPPAAPMPEARARKQPARTRAARKASAGRKRARR